MSLGQRIKEYAKKKGIKFSAIAERANIPQNTFSAIINGNRRITAEEYFDICKALEVPIEYFCEQQIA